MEARHRRPVARVSDCNPSGRRRLPGAGEKGAGFASPRQRGVRARPTPPGRGRETPKMERKEQAVLTRGQVVIAGHRRLGDKRLSNRTAPETTVAPYRERAGLNTPSGRHSSRAGPSRGSSNFPSPAPASGSPVHRRLRDIAAQGDRLRSGDDPARLCGSARNPRAGHFRSSNGARGCMRSPAGHRWRTPRQCRRSQSTQGSNPGPAPRPHERPSAEGPRRTRRRRTKGPASSS
jgi:hypothetical protein